MGRDHGGFVGCIVPEGLAGKGTNASVIESCLDKPKHVVIKDGKRIGLSSQGKRGKKE